MEGRAHKVPAQTSDEYFSQRPQMSQVSARISAQSRPIDSRDTLLQRQQQELERFRDEKSIPRPDFWGGYHIVPERFEFWQGQSDRLHDRLVFTRGTEQNEVQWSMQRLQP